MTYKCKSSDFGVLPLFHLTTNGQIKFPLNLLRHKIPKKEIMLAKGLEKNNVSYKIIPRNASNDECIENGFSTFGHSDESINSSYRTWFSEDKFNEEAIIAPTSTLDPPWNITPLGFKNISFPLAFKLP